MMISVNSFGGKGGKLLLPGGSSAGRRATGAAGGGQTELQVDEMIMALMNYLLGMPDTSLSGRRTRMARKVRKSTSRSSCANSVTNLRGEASTNRHTNNGIPVN